jgi:hypothetical protein
VARGTHSSCRAASRELHIRHMPHACEALRAKSQGKRQPPALGTGTRNPSNSASESHWQRKDPSASRKWEWPPVAQRHASPPPVPPPPHPPPEEAKRRAWPPGRSKVRDGTMKYILGLQPQATLRSLVLLLENAGDSMRLDQYGCCGDE